MPTASKEFSEVERIAHVTIRAGGNEFFGSQIVVLHYVGAQVGRGPGAWQRGEKRQQGGESEGAARQKICVGRICADGDLDQALHGVDVIQRVEPETEAEDQAEHPEAIAKLEIGGFHRSPDAAGSSERMLYA
jgi:hypothetical protein